MASQSSKDKFLAIWPSLSEELTAYLEENHMPAEAVAWFKKVRNSFCSSGISH